MRKRAVSLATVLALVVLMAACAAKKPIHPGAVNQADSDVYDALLTAQAALNQAKVEFASNPAAKAPLNQAIAAYNTALDGYLAYHAGASNNLAAVQAQVTALIQDIAALQKQFGVTAVKQ